MRFCQSLLGGFLVPSERFFGVLGHKFSVLIKQSEIILCFCDPLLGIRFVPLKFFPRYIVNRRLRESIHPFAPFLRPTCACLILRARSRNPDATFRLFALRNRRLLRHGGLPDLRLLFRLFRLSARNVCGNRFDVCPLCLPHRRCVLFFLLLRLFPRDQLRQTHCFQFGNEISLFLTLFIPRKRLDQILFHSVSVLVELPDPSVRVLTAFFNRDQIISHRFFIIALHAMPFFITIRNLVICQRIILRRRPTKPFECFLRFFFDARTE